MAIQFIQGHPGARQIRRNPWGRWEGWKHGVRVRVFEDSPRFMAVEKAVQWRAREKFRTETAKGRNMIENNYITGDKHNCDVLAAQNAELRDLLQAAVRRVEIANADGDPILSAWRTDAEKVLAKLEGK
jgi:hypothetical protein